MDIFNLNEKVKGLVSYLQDTGYSAMYIDYVKKMLSGYRAIPNITNGRVSPMLNRH